MAFKAGDTVQLKSGSAIMTVETFDDAKGRYVCVWHDKNEEKRGEYLEATLQAAVRPIGAVGRRR
jgi:uncharacterized protein YodC (DUF2158 family)